MHKVKLEELKRGDVISLWPKSEMIYVTGISKQGDKIVIKSHNNWRMIDYPDTVVYQHTIVIKIPAV